MFLGLSIIVLLRKRKKYLRILAISLKATCEEVYVLQPPAYTYRGTWRGLLLLTTMIHGLMHLWKWLHFFQGIFHQLPPSCLFVIVTSSMLKYECLAWETFSMLKISSVFWGGSAHPSPNRIFFCTPKTSIFCLKMRFLTVSTF